MTATQQGIYKLLNLIAILWITKLIVPHLAYSAESCKCNSAPATPTTSITASMEDLRRKRAFTRSTDIVKSPIKLSQYLLAFKSAQDSKSEQEPAANVEREGKKKGALGAMKKYFGNCILLYLSLLL